MSTSLDAAKQNKRLGFTMISIALAFYFFPDFALIDIFPDIFSYILICIGLNKLSYLNEDIDAARKLFFKMLLVGAGKFVAVFITFGTSNAEEQSSLMLLMLFVLAVFELLMLIPAYTHLFEGLLYLGMRNEGTAVFGKKYDRFKKSATEKLRNKTVAFIIIKNAALVLPETASLSISDNFNSYKISMYEFIPHFRILGMIVSLIFGIIWLVSAVSYFRSINRDEVFVNALNEKFNTEIMPNQKVFIERKVGLACLFFGIAAVFAVDFYINGNNGYNIIPDAMFAIAAFFGVLIIRKYISDLLFFGAEALCVLYGIVSSVNWKIISDFSYQYTAAQVRTDAEAYYKWQGLLAMSAVEALCFFLTVIALLWIVKTLIYDHTGYCSPHSMIDPKVKLAELHKKLMVSVYTCGAFALLAAAGGVFRVYMFRTANMISDMSWIIEAAVTAVFAISFIMALLKLNEQVQEKYSY